MANYSQLFSQAQRTIAQVAGVQITYSRGTSSVSVTAVPARSNFDSDGENVIVEYRARDFIVAAEDLVLNGSPISPKSGDKIFETVGETVHTYVVGRSDAREQPYRFTDTGRSNLRIHTTLQGVA